MLYVASSRMDATAVQGAYGVFENLARADQDLTIDMANVDYIDCSGVGALVYLLKRLRTRRHTIKVINLNGQPKQLFEQLRLTGVIGK